MEELEDNTINENERTDSNYPGVSDRIKAAVADSVIIIGFIICLTLIFSQFEHVPDHIRMIAFIFVFGLYDPICTSFLGGTLGHMSMNIRVKKLKDQNRNIVIHLAIIRYIVKVLLGWISLLTISRDSKGLAIHDMLVGSVVVYKEKRH